MKYYIPSKDTILVLPLNGELIIYVIVAAEEEVIPMPSPYAVLAQ